MADIAELIVALKLRDGVSGGLGKLNSQLRGMQGNLSQVGRGVGQVGHGLSQLATRGAIAAGGGIAYVAHAAIEFEDAFTGVAKTVDATDEQLAGLSDSIRAMAREMPIGTTELASLAEQAGALGIAVNDIDEFTRVTALLGTTTNVASIDAATALGQLSNVLNLTGDDYERFASTLVDLGNKGASTEADILAIASRAGAAGDLIGLSADQVLSFGSAVANLGIEAEAGGSALQKFFIDSLTNLQDKKTLEIMADTAGTTGAAFKKAFEDDAAGALESFLKGLGELDEAAQINTLQSLGFNDVRITRMLLGFANNTDNLTESLNIGAEAWKANSALQDEAERKFANTASQLKILKNNVNDAAITVGNELLPVIADLSHDLVDFLNQPGTQAGLKDFAQGLAEGIRGLAGELKGTDFSGIIGGMKIAAGVAKGAFDAFRALPEPIQQLAIAALVANKVSGGAVGNIAKGLANILIGTGGLLSKGGSPANPLWVAMAGGGLPGGGGVPGVGGVATAKPFLPTSIAGWASLLAVAAADAVLVKMAADEFNNQLTNVNVGASFEKSVVASRSENATVEELRGLREDLKTQLAAGGGDPIADVLKGVFVNSDLEDQIEAVDQQIRANTAAVTSGQAEERQQAWQRTQSQINEFRQASNERRTEHNAVMGQAARALSNDVAMLNTARTQTTAINNTRAAADRVKTAVDVGRQATQTGFQSTSGRLDTTNARLSTANAQLGVIAGKNWSPLVKITQTNTVSSTVIQQRITQQRAITGTGFTSGSRY